MFFSVSTKQEPLGSRGRWHGSKWSVKEHFTIRNRTGEYAFHGTETFNSTYSETLHDGTSDWNESRTFRNQTKLLTLFRLGRDVIKVLKCLWLFIKDFLWWIQNIHWNIHFEHSKSTIKRFFYFNKISGHINNTCVIRTWW